MSKIWTELTPFLVRKLIADALTEKEGRVYLPHDIQLEVEIAKKGHGMFATQEARFVGAVATFEDTPDPEPVEKEPHPGWAQYGMGGRSSAPVADVVICTECSTRRLDENGNCPSCDREEF